MAPPHTQSPPKRDAFALLLNNGGVKPGSHPKPSEQRVGFGGAGVSKNFKIHTSQPKSGPIDIRVVDSEAVI